MSIFSQNFSFQHIYISTPNQQGRTEDYLFFGGGVVQDNVLSTKYRGQRAVKANRIAFLTDL